METLKKIFEVIKKVVFEASNVTLAILGAIFAAAGAPVGAIVSVAVLVVLNVIHLGYKIFK